MPLDSTIKVLSLRMQIRENIKGLCDQIDDIKNETHLRKYFFFRKYFIYNKLESCINSLHKIVLKNNELNKVALKKDKNKYGYSQKLLTTNILEKQEKSEVYDFFQNSLMNIENICSSEKNKDRIIRKFMKEKLGFNYIFS